MVAFSLAFWKGLEPGAVVNEAPVGPQSGTLSEAAAECESHYIPTKEKATFMVAFSLAFWKGLERMRL